MKLREFLENNTSISQLDEKYEVRPNDIYNWKKKLFESAADIFTPKVSAPKQSAKGRSAKQKKIENLQSKVKDHDEAISYLIHENIEIKKVSIGRAKCSVG